MPMQEYFHDLVSGRKTGFTATMFRGGLRLLEMPYSSIVSVRNFLYDKQILSSRQFDVPIISVGNITLGGTGKSPMVAWLCRYFLGQNRHPGLISRGYGKGIHACNDEFMEMSFRFPTVPHLQNPNRAEAIQKLLHTGQIDLIILDDAFQHRRVKRDIDVVLLDAMAPFGFNHIFPRGTLREPPRALCRADIVLLTRSDLINELERKQIQQQVGAFNPNIIWGETVHTPTSLISIEAGTMNYNTEPIDFIHGQSALAFCGIGNPAAFQKTLERCGVHVMKLIPFPDHYRYAVSDIDEILQTAKSFGTDLILCTMKDLVKLNRSKFIGHSFRAVSIDIQFTVGESVVCKRLQTPKS